MRPTYDGGAESYFDSAYRDYAAQNPNRKLDHYLKQITIHGLHGAPDVSLLDIGCGRGSFLKRAAETHPDWNLSGTDIDTDGVSATRRLVPNAQVFEASAADASFAPNTFDVITAWDVLEHVPDLAEVPQSVNSMLRPAGLFAFVVPVYDGMTGPIIRRLDKDPTHLHKKGRDWWISWAESSEFEVLEWHGIFRYLVAPGRYIHHPTTRFRSHSPAIFVACRSRAAI